MTNDNSDNPLFLGDNAQQVYKTLSGAQRLRGVPLENTGGPGTASSHWKKSVFGNELMTGYINTTFSPLSVLTVAAFDDMGYEVDYTKADPYLLSTPVVSLYGSGLFGTGYSYFHPCQHKTICPKTIYYSNLY